MLIEFEGINNMIVWIDPTDISFIDKEPLGIQLKVFTKSSGHNMMHIPVLDSDKNLKTIREVLGK